MKGDEMSALKNCIVCAMIIIAVIVFGGCDGDNSMVAPSYNHLPEHNIVVDDNMSDIGCRKSMITEMFIINAGYAITANDTTKKKPDPEPVEASWGYIKERYQHP